MKRFALALCALVALALPAAADKVSAYDRAVVGVSGACAIAYTFEATEPTQLIRADLIFSAAQEDATAITMTLDSARGAAFDALYFSATPSTAEGSTQYFQVWPPLVESPLYLEPGDKLIFAYANADSDTFGIRMVLSAPTLASATIAQECPEPEGEGEGAAEGE